jgi:hypothetical protein
VEDEMNTVLFLSSAFCLCLSQWSACGQGLSHATPLATITNPRLRCSLSDNGECRRRRNFAVAPDYDGIDSALFHSVPTEKENTCAGRQLGHNKNWEVTTMHTDKAPSRFGFLAEPPDKTRKIVIGPDRVMMIASVIAVAAFVIYSVLMLYAIITVS